MAGCITVVGATTKLSYCAVSSLKPRGMCTKALIAEILIRPYSPAKEHSKLVRSIVQRARLSTDIMVGS